MPMLGRMIPLSASWSRALEVLEYHLRHIFPFELHRRQFLGQAVMKMMTGRRRRALPRKFEDSADDPRHWQAEMVQSLQRKNLVELEEVMLNIIDEPL